MPQMDDAGRRRVQAIIALSFNTSIITFEGEPPIQDLARTVVQQPLSLRDLVIADVDESRLLREDPRTSSLAFSLVGRSHGECGLRKHASKPDVGLSLLTSVISDP